ncbi:DUF2225 domain-containing protein [Clostridium sp. Cult3]|uniref:DUF2225 domain-containing protein n=1 Tax=Clostridium sp. Cult3 TaxID=2079004 RepID=UPI001F266499|nr:DUF2225 domain-containing protein [Clostridium sp. Cult3]MCF6460920.1 DUF2225 domain-containing protein [Clostridium sp. Cult3]
MTEIGELYDKDIKCPTCDKQFKTKKVRRSKLRLTKRDEDFLSYYERQNPLKYNIYVCPNCGYAASESRFSSLSYENKQIILEKITSKWNKRSYGHERTAEEAIETYKLALYIGELLNYGKVELGFLCLSIAWLYRIEEVQEEEVRFLGLARDLFEEGYYKESLVNVNIDELRLGYLVGELNRRLGNKEEALKWFNTVLSNPDLKYNPMIDKMTREQWRLTREG